MVSDGGMTTLHFVFLVLNNDFMIFYSRVWRMSNIMDNMSTLLRSVQVVQGTL